MSPFPEAPSPSRRSISDSSLTGACAPSSGLGSWPNTSIHCCACSRASRGTVQVELPQVQDEFRRELRSTTPILGLYRDYAAVGVRVNPRAAATVSTAPPDPFAQESAVPAGGQETSPVQRESASPRAAAHPRPAPPEDPAPQPPASAVGRRVGCRSCRQPLPLSGGMDVRFCPFCGESQQPVPCRECGTSLEPGWSFCVYCGTSRRLLPSPRA